HLANSDNNTFWVIPGELTEAIRTVTTAFGDQPAAPPQEAADSGAGHTAAEGGTPPLDAGWTASFDAAAAADEAGRQAAAAVSDAKAEAEAAKSAQTPRRGQTSGDG
ncbi:SPFH/Band 7/PHB domain protein, partial [Streptomyces massasporeus]